MTLRKWKVLVLAGAAMVMTQPASAEDLITAIQTGCKTDIANYCSKVTQGEGRMLACFYAHEDKLSNSCVSVLYDAATVLVAAVEELRHLAQACGEDIEGFCGDVEMGDGRVANCLGEHVNELSDTCTDALAEVGSAE